MSIRFRDVKYTSYFCFMAKIPVTFYRKGRKGFAGNAKALRSLRKLCALCGKKVASL
jgi:hypothetical protein